MTDYWKKWGLIAAAAGLIAFIYLLSPILTPFFIAGFFAYIGDPLVNRLIKWHIPRTLAVICVFLLIFSILFLLIILLVPVLQNQIVMLIERVPALIGWVQNTAMPWLHAHFDINSTLNVNSIKATLLSNWQQAGNVADKVLKAASHSGLAFMTFLINIILVPVVTFYLLRDWPILIAKLTELIPRKILPKLRQLLRECDEVLSAFFRGQLLVMLALGVIYSVGLSIIGLDLALLIGVLIAIFSIVPYLGTLIGLLAAVGTTLFQFHDITHVIYVLILFVIGHLLEGMVLTPLLIGDRIGLHPVAVIFAILAGGQLFGFLGVLLALPVAAVVMVWIRYLHNRYLNSDLYHT